MNTHKIEFAVVSSYFDFNDYDNPIHYYLQDLNLYYLMPALSQYANYRVKTNQATISDSLLFGGQGDKSQVDFYSMNYRQTMFSTVEAYNSYLNIIISLDQQTNEYQRTVFSFLDMFGFIGGIFGIMQTIGNLMIQFFIVREFYSTILWKLFSGKENYVIQNKIQSKPNIGILFKHSPKSTANKIDKKFDSFLEVQDEEKVQSNFKEGIQEEEKSHVGLKPPFENHSQLIINEIDEDTRQIEQDFELSNNKTISKFEYSFKDMMYEFFWLHKLKFKNKKWELFRERIKEYKEK